MPMELDSEVEEAGVPRLDSTVRAKVPAKESVQPQQNVLGVASLGQTGGDASHGPLRVTEPEVCASASATVRGLDIQGPPPTVGGPRQSPALQIIQRIEESWGPCPLYGRLQASLDWWSPRAAPNVVDLLRGGLQPPRNLPATLSTRECWSGDVGQATQILLEYEKCGAVKKVSPVGTKHLIPWFVIQKPEGSETKWRFISNCKEINHYFQVVPFKLDHIQNIFPTLQKGHWAAKIDLKDAYFHVPVHPSLRPYLRHQVGDQVWEYQAGCFGLNVMPQVFMSIMKTFEKLWRSKGIQVFIYLDDILLVAQTSTLVEKHLVIIVKDLARAGFKVNVKKSVLEPRQVVDHLGFVLDFTKGELQVSPHKVKGIRKELGKFITKDSMSKRQTAAILGKIRANIFALPFLKAFTDSLCQFLLVHSADSWDSFHSISPEIKDQLREVKSLMAGWSGRPFLASPSRVLHSDSSTHGWGGLDAGTGEMVQEYWREKAVLHINVKELQAAVNTVRSLSKSGETVELRVDNQVTYFYLTKGGGRKCPLNAILRPFFQWCMEKKSTCKVGTLQRMFGRPHFQVGARQGGLFPGHVAFPAPKTGFFPAHLLGNRLVCFPGEQKVRQF